MANPYDLLGISKTATDAEIKKAYHKLARTLHPDVNPDKQAAEKFKAVSAAYELLSDKDKRQRFDAGLIDENGNPTPFGAGGYGAGGMGGFGDGRTQYRTHNINPEDFAAMFGGGGFNFSDIFGDMSGMSGFGRRASSAGFAGGGGQDVDYELSVPFDLSVTGGDSTVTLNNGKRIKIKIPAGITDDYVLRLKGQGVGGGAAMVRMRILPSPLYVREGNNVILTVPITLAEAVLGAKITIPTPSGKVAVKVPPHSTSGTTLRLKGKGVTGKGDFLAKLSVALPDSANAELTEFVKKWSDPTGNPRHF